MRFASRGAHVRRGAFFTAVVLIAGFAVGVGSRSTARAANPADLLDVLRIGTGSSGLSSSATPAFIVPFLGVGPGQGTVGTPIPLPTAQSGSNAPLTMSGSASSEGSLELSGNGQYLTVAGYDATPGTAGVASSTTIPRVAGRIDGAGNIDTSTVLKLGSFSGNNARGAVTNDGNEFWVTGAGGNPRGIVYAPLGNGAAATAVTSNNTNARVPVIAGGQLYLSTNNNTPPGLYKVGTGLPTGSPSATAVTPLVTGSSSDPYAFVFTDANTLYVADPPGIKKYWFNGSAWVPQGSATAPGQLAGLTGKVENGAVQLYATDLNGTTIYAFTDSAASNSTISGSFSTLAHAPANTLYKGVAFAPAGQTLSNAPPTISLQDSALTRSIGDTYSPTQTTATVSDLFYTDPSQLTVTATSSNTAVVPSVSVSGTGGTRTITVTPADTVGISNIVVTVSTPDGRSASATLEYGVSAQAPDATSYWLSGGFSNASTAQDAGDGYFIVGDDEFNQPALYKAGVSGGPVKTWNFDTQMGVADSSQIDIEASARLGSTIYWFGSEGNNSDGSVKANRAIVFATTISGSGASTELAFAGFYRNLRNDLLAWDTANGNQFGFVAGAADGQIPKEVNGYNIEGAEFAAGASSTLYLGFRAPIVPTSNRTQALVVPVTNLIGLMSPNGTSGGPAAFGSPMQWNLTPSGYTNPLGDTPALGIREIPQERARPVHDRRRLLRGGSCSADRRRGVPLRLGRQSG